jgi:hypothetical protein
VKRSKEQKKKRLEKIAVLINSQAKFGGCNVQSFKHWLATFPATFPGDCGSFETGMKSRPASEDEGEWR